MSSENGQAFLEFDRYLYVRERVLGLDNNRYYYCIIDRFRKIEEPSKLLEKCRFSYQTHVLCRLFLDWSAGINNDGGTVARVRFDFHVIWLMTTKTTTSSLRSV